MGTLDRNEYERLARWMDGALDLGNVLIAALLALWVVHAAGVPLPWGTDLSAAAAAGSVMLASAVRIAWWLVEPDVDHGIR